MKSAFVPVGYGDTSFTATQSSALLGIPCGSCLGECWDTMDAFPVLALVFSLTSSQHIFSLRKTDSWQEGCPLDGPCQGWQVGDKAVSWLGAEFCSGADKSLGSPQLWAASGLLCLALNSLAIFGLAISLSWETWEIILWIFLVTLMPCSFPEGAFIGLFEFWLCWT